MEFTFVRPHENTATVLAYHFGEHIGLMALWRVMEHSDEHRAGFYELMEKAGHEGRDMFMDVTRRFHRDLFEAAVEGELPETRGVTRSHLVEMARLADVYPPGPSETILALYKRYHEVMGQTFDDEAEFRRKLGLVEA